MATAIKGDPESKLSFVRHTLDQAFSDRVSVIFNVLCNDFESETAVRWFTDKFVQATNCWNQARDAVEAEYAPQPPAKD